MVELEYSALGVTQVRSFETVEDAMNAAACIIREGRGRPTRLWSGGKYIDKPAIYAWAGAPLEEGDG